MPPIQSLQRPNAFGSGGGASWLFDAESYQKPFIAGIHRGVARGGQDCPNAKYAYAKGGRAIPDVCGFGQDVAYDLRRAPYRAGERMARHQLRRNGQASSGC